MEKNVFRKKNLTTKIFATQNFGPTTIFWNHNNFGTTTIFGTTKLKPKKMIALIRSFFILSLIVTWLWIDATETEGGGGWSTIWSNDQEDYKSGVGSLRGSGWTHFSSMGKTCSLYGMPTTILLEWKHKCLATTSGAAAPGTFSSNARRRSWLPTCAHLSTGRVYRIKKSTGTVHNLLLIIISILGLDVHFAGVFVETIYQWRPRTTKDFGHFVKQWTQTSRCPTEPRSETWSSEFANLCGTNYDCSWPPWSICPLQLMVGRPTQTLLLWDGPWINSRTHTWDLFPLSKIKFFSFLATYELYVGSSTSVETTHSQTSCRWGSFLCLIYTYQSKSTSHSLLTICEERVPNKGSTNPWRPT